MININDTQNTISSLLKEQLNNGKQVHFTVTGKSMKPLIRVGDEVIVERVNPDKLQPGEIILFERGNVFCTHRFIKRIHDKTKFVTKGDNFFRFDPPLPENDILGKVVAIKRNDEFINLTQSKYRRFNFVFAKTFLIQWFIFVLIRPIRNFVSNYFNKNYKR